MEISIEVSGGINRYIVFNIDGDCFFLMKVSVVY